MKTMFKSKPIIRQKKNEEEEEEEDRNQGDRIRTYELYTQNRCADQTTLQLVSTPGVYRSTRLMNTCSKLAHPFGHRDARINPCNLQLFLEKLPPAR